MSFTRLSVFIAALALLSFAGPAHANSLHTEKGASGQGLIADANFTSVTRTVDGVTIGQFDDQTTLYDVFTIPSSFETGTPFVLTFADITQGYGIFDCDNGTNNFALSADSPAVALVGPCTTGPLGSNDVFVNFVESGFVQLERAGAEFDAAAGVGIGWADVASPPRRSVIRSNGRNEVRSRVCFAFHG